MNALRGTLRPWVVVALIGWMIGVGIPIIFRGGGVRSILQCGEDPACGDWPWGAIWVVGCLVILTIGFLTRKRATSDMELGLPSVEPGASADGEMSMTERDGSPAGLKAELAAALAERDAVQAEVDACRGGVPLELMQRRAAAELRYREAEKSLSLPASAPRTSRSPDR